MHFNFRKRLKSGEVLLGTLITIPAPEVAEIMAASGFDWLFVDTEHGAFNAQGALGILQAADHCCPCIVRIPSNEDVLDAVLVGPYDLSASMGKMGRINDAAVQAAITTITQNCHQAGVPLGIFADSAESEAPFIKKGHTLIAIGTDVLHMAHSAKATLQAVKAG